MSKKTAVLVRDPERTSKKRSLVSSLPPQLPSFLLLKVSSFCRIVQIKEQRKKSVVVEKEQSKK